MTITRNGACIALTPAELLSAYREQELAFREEDARRQAANCVSYYCALGDDGQSLADAIFRDEDYDNMARRFIDEYDCEISENGKWGDIVEDALDDCLAKGRLTVRQFLVASNREDAKFIDPNTGVSARLSDYGDHAHAERFLNLIVNRFDGTTFTPIVYGLENPFAN